MRITYRTLRKLIDMMDEEQLSSDLTIELNTIGGTECYPADLRIAGEGRLEHGESLDYGCPVIYLDLEDENEHERRVDVAGIAKNIGLS